MQGIAIDKITTKRLILRIFTPEDAADVFEYAGDTTDANRYIRFELHQNQEDSLRVIKEFFIPNHVFAIEFDGKVIGSIELKLSEMNTGEVGYILNKKYWNKGFMTEALQAVLNYAFLDLWLDAVISSHAVPNIASRTVQTKCGFKEDSVVPNGIELRGQIYDVRNTSITRDEYLSMV